VSVARNFKEEINMHYYSIRSDAGGILNSDISIQNHEGHFGLVIESRGGAKGKSNERNTNYMEALEVIIERLQDAGITTVQVYVVARCQKHWPMEDRIIQVNGTNKIDIQSATSEELRLDFGRAIRNKFPDPSKTGHNSTRRILICAPLTTIGWKAIIRGNAVPDDEINAKDVSISDPFNPSDVDDAKEIAFGAITIRRGQPKFRRDLIKAYNGKCAVTGTAIIPLLEAAHIVPYQGKKTNHISNGLLLRADIHTLFDLNRLTINSDLEVVVSTSLKGTEYGQYQGKKLAVPAPRSQRPSRAAVAWRLANLK
jgi:HNH endonuclease